MRENDEWEIVPVGLSQNTADTNKCDRDAREPLGQPWNPDDRRSERRSNAWKENRRPAGKAHRLWLGAPTFPRGSLS
jgi:hypothetical protein